jgi:hypothetical protein
MTSNTGLQTETLHQQILMRPEVEEHPFGHTSKVYRYRTRMGHEFALEKRRNYPILLVPVAAVRTQPSFLDVTTVPAGRKGRNHNLNRLPTFRDRPLLRLQVRSVSDADELLRRIG